LRQAQVQLADRAGQLEQAVAVRTAELTLTNKQLEAFAYSITHDLRAPASFHPGLFRDANCKDADSALSETGRDFAKRISRSAQFMNALLQDLLAFSQLSRPRIELA
jgi:light-regulated signal transduction histidine kinase (bacteriophytochrome)